ncbi:SDR family NAD(P)-dependent oxidoreductase [Amorphus sp. 3PC139-8]|uniref:SDR family NAD(P)-dependent oxidoreductase n=1 Tax=Amorphus sp. 3PC139-8 TaxID=2735676 RepID=UPI00345DDF99
MSLDATSPGTQRALVTGATGGIGWAICQTLAAQGVRIALADLDAATVQARAAALGPEHVALAADLTDPTTAARLPARAAEALGGLDFVVNNAGVTDSSGRSLIDLPADAFDRLVALNLTAVEAICEAAAGLLPRGGRIVNLASGASWKPLAKRGPYSATKAGIVALTRALAETLAPHGIVASAVAPGYTRTPLVDELQRTGRVDLEAVARSIPLGRIALPDDIAKAVAFCAGPDSTALAGETILVDGGGSAGPAPSDTAPPAGTSEGGALAVLGPLKIDSASAIATDRDRLGEQAGLAAVIDATAFLGSLSPAEVLDGARRTALACATHDGRARDFSLLFVAPEGQTPAQQAACAALAMLARTLALEWAGAGLRVNALTWRGRSRGGLGAICGFLTDPRSGFITAQSLRAGDPH